MLALKHESVDATSSILFNSTVCKFTWIFTRQKLTAEMCLLMDSVKLG